MSVRAKMQLRSVTEEAWGGKTLKFGCQYDTSIPEDQRFQKATPCGKFTMTVDNPAALDQLTPGKAFYIDLTPVP